MTACGKACLILGCAMALLTAGGFPECGNGFLSFPAESPVAGSPMGVALAFAEVSPSQASQGAENTKETVKVKLRDLELLDQDGSKLSFKKDVIGDRVAVVIPFYTTCTTAYPILVFMFTRLQSLLGDHLGKDVVLVSVSVDPSTDIPIRLKAYARRQNAKPGWVFLTGDRRNLGEVLWGVGVLYSSNLEEHNHIPITLVGNAQSEWRRFHGFPSPEQVMAEVSQSLATKPAQ